MTTNYLLDTNALSEASKKKPDQGYIRWLTAAEETTLFTSCLVLGEIKKGIEICPDGKRQREFDTLLAEIIHSLDGRIIELDTPTALLWGELVAAGQRAGTTPPVIDALIAAQCITHNLTLVTRNVKDFEQFSSLRLHSPWSSYTHNIQTCPHSTIKP